MAAVGAPKAKKDGRAVARHRYYAYLRKSGEVEWMTRKTHVMLLKYPAWLTHFHVQKSTGESRLLTVEEFLTLKRARRTPFP